MGLAARGSRHLGEQAEQIADPEELAQVRRQARKVQLKSMAAGAAMALLTLLIP